jgi:hypothetical protein
MEILDLKIVNDPVTKSTLVGDLVLFVSKYNYKNAEVLHGVLHKTGCKVINSACLEGRCYLFITCSEEIFKEINRVS